MEYGVIVFNATIVQLYRGFSDVCCIEYILVMIRILTPTFSGARHLPYDRDHEDPHYGLNGNGEYYFSVKHSIIL